LLFAEFFDHWRHTGSQLVITGNLSDEPPRSVRQDEILDGQDRAKREEEGQVTGESRDSAQYGLSEKH
jgi:hypothetical protein